MAAIQGHVTNSRGTATSAIAHQHMEAMVRTWTGGFCLTVHRDDTFSLSFGPHGNVGATRLLEGRIVDDGTSLDITFLAPLLRSLAGSGE